MSKYEPLWHFLKKSGADTLTLSFAQIGELLGFPLEHFFLNAKKEAAAFGYTVGKISLRQQTVAFFREKQEEAK